MGQHITEDKAPLVAHVIHTLRVGGLENGLVNLINQMPPERYRHAIVCLTDYDEFAQRISQPGIPLFSLNKKVGQDWGLYPRLWRVFRKLRPDIVHTRNLGAMEAQLPALLAGVGARVHGEHGRDELDLDGTNRRHRWLRRRLRPLVHHFIPLSLSLEAYLSSAIGVSTEHMTRICNGVDTERFRLPVDGRPPLPWPRAGKQQVIIGSVGRMETVKDPLNLAQAFVHLVTRSPRWREQLRLVMIGNGSLRDRALTLLRDAGVEHLAWLPGKRDDVPAVLQCLDIFVLPSLSEGISNTLLEAMSSGLPVVATNVGGNPEIAKEGETAFLVPRSDSAALAVAIEKYAGSSQLRNAHGQAARRLVEQNLSLSEMVGRYMSVYDQVLRRRRWWSRS